MADLKLSYQYIVTEEGLRKLVGGQWPEQLIKDYLSSKYSAQQIADAINSNSDKIAVIEGEIVVINGQITTLTANLNAHIAAEAAHGSTGNIVGTDDYCTATVGGTVLLAAAVSDALDSTVTITGGIAAAPAAYSQAYAQQQTDKINELCTDLTSVIGTLNDLVDLFNQAKGSEVVAKQRSA
jgi:hypothetical protein